MLKTDSVEHVLKYTVFAPCTVCVCVWGGVSENLSHRLSVHTSKPQVIPTDPSNY